MPDFIECPSADCTYGHFHKVEEDGREWTCKKCGKLACASCRAPWHQDETCEQYSTRTSDHLENVRIIENDNSERSVIECPSCKIKIQKADGCDHMTCNCGAQFCYDCRALFLPGKTEGWENTLAVLHESECRHYKKDGRGYEILGLTWQEFRDIKAEVFFGLVHGEIMIRCSSDGKKVFAEVLTNRVTIWWE